jgi:hypothetical protein
MDFDYLIVLCYISYKMYTFVLQETLEEKEVCK